MRDGTREPGSLPELNRRFLDLEWTRARLGARLAALSDPEKSAAADCPYALFDLRFHDGDYWQTRLQTQDGWGVADGPAVDLEAVDFVRLALFYAWHCATSARSSARLVFGMHDRTAQAFAGTTVSRLAALAPRETPHLAARWHHCDRFWSALVNAAGCNDPTGLRRIQLYGIQLGVAAQLPLRP